METVGKDKLSTPVKMVSVYSLSDNPRYIISSIDTNRTLVHTSGAVLKTFLNIEVTWAVHDDRMAGGSIAQKNLSLAHISLVFVCLRWEFTHTHLAIIMYAWTLTKVCIAW
jgi:hypothetical protein